MNENMAAIGGTPPAIDSTSQVCYTSECLLGLPFAPLSPAFESIVTKFGADDNIIKRHKSEYPTMIF